VRHFPSNRAGYCDGKITASVDTEADKRAGLAAAETSEVIEQAAKVCHETLRVFCQTIGDNSLLAWEEAPEWQKESSRDGVRFYFEQFAAGIEPSPSATHERWLKQKRAEGWKHGETKNSETKEHPSFVPYNELPLTEKRKDYLFAAVCKAFCESASAETVKTKSRG